MKQKNLESKAIGAGTGEAPSLRSGLLGACSQANSSCFEIISMHNTRALTPFILTTMQDSFSNFCLYYTILSLTFRLKCPLGW